MPQPLPADSSLWDFACWLYQQNKVKETCLNLQNEQKADINLVLFCCWHGLTLGEIHNDLWPRLLECSNHWQQQTLQPLRTLRNTFKQKPYPKVYQQFLALELVCEQAQLEQMEALAQSKPEQHPDSGLQACKLNLRQYLTDTLKRPTATTSAAISELLAALN